MPSDVWNTFRERLVVHERKAIYIRYWGQISELLALSDDALIARLRDDVLPMDEVAFGYFCDTLTLIAVKPAIPGGADDLVFQRLTFLRQSLHTIRTPIVRPTMTDAEMAVFAQASALDDRLSVLSVRASVGLADADVLDGLSALIAEYRHLLEQTSLENSMRRMVLDGLESGLESAGRCSFLLHRYDQAADWYDAAAVRYCERGEVVNAQRSRERADAIRRVSSGDVDETVRKNLLILLGQKDPDCGSLAGVAAQVDLLEQTVKAGDLFGAATLLAEAASLLLDRGYVDPYTCDSNTAFTQWLSMLPGELAGNDLLAALGSLFGFYTTLLGARSLLVQKGDAVTEQRVQVCLSEMHAYTSKLFTQAMQAEADLEKAWVDFSNHPLGMNPELTAQLAAIHVQSDSVQQRVIALGQAISAFPPEVDRREAAGEPLDALLAEAQRIVLEATTLGQPMYAALAALNQADLFLELQQPDQAIGVVHAARTAWAKVFVETENGDAEQRCIDVRFLLRLIRASAQRNDLVAISSYAQEAITLIERDRYKVSSPYLQSAFLSERAEIYMLGIFSAWKLNDIVTMLERMELVKARMAFRLRYLPEMPDHAVTDLDAQFRAVTAQIDAASAATLPHLLEQRRRIWDLVSITRMRESQAVIPEFSLAALQARLGTNEAVVSYYWLSETVLLVTAIEATSTLVERVVLSNVEQEQIQEVLDGIATLTHDNDMLDDAIQACASTCFPPRIAASLATKDRIIFSPHHALHLYPFHALNWNGRRLIEHAAISYTPCLSMLLTPQVPEVPNRALLVGVSDFSQVKNIALIPLSGVDREVQEVAAVYQERNIPVDTLTNAAATRTALLARNDTGTLAEYRCIVFATHGTSVFAADTLNAPMESRLYLYDAACDGLEISRLRLSADTVVLSACYSGQRAVGGRGLPNLPGDELFGLQAAFNMAGARRVLACLWPTDDAVAPGLMQAFHRACADGASADRALQAAIVGHLGAGTSIEPFYWALYFLVTFA